MDYTKDKFDIIIQAGQSNAQGCGRGEVTKEYVPDTDILYLEPDFTVKEGIVGDIWKLILDYGTKAPEIRIASEDGRDVEKLGDFSLTFAGSYKDAGLLEDGRKLLIIRAGVGGTGFFKKYWGQSDECYLKMIEMIDMALRMNEENRLVAFLWHQGEHDAFEGNPPDVFEGQLEEMATSVRTRYGVPALPFISGDFVRDWKGKNIGICAPIVEKIRLVTARLGGEFVETSDLPSNDEKVRNGDDIHFCRESLHILGHRYFDAYLKILNR